MSDNNDDRIRLSFQDGLIYLGNVQNEVFKLMIKKGQMTQEEYDHIVNIEKKKVIEGQRIERFPDYKVN